MAPEIVVREILQIPLAVKNRRETADILRFDAHVGHHASPVVHLPAAGGPEFPDQRVGYGSDAAVVVAVGVVERLNAPSAGNVVLGRSDFQKGIVAERAGRLHESLAEGPLAEQYGAVQILQRARDDLGSRGRLAVDQHDDGHPRIDRVGLRRERLVEFADTAFHRHDFGPFGNQQGENLDGLLQYASAVASQVDDQRRGALLLELDERAAHVEAALFREIVVQDVSDPVGDHAVIGNARYLDALAP